MRLKRQAAKEDYQDSHAAADTETPKGISEETSPDAGQASYSPHTVEKADRE